MKKIVIPMFAAMAVLAGCSGNSDQMKRLQQENDSLVIVATQSKAEMDELLATIADVEAGFAQIREAEGYITVNAQGNDITPSTREKLASDMQMIQQTLKDNREKLDKLQKLYDDSKSQSAQLKKTIERLSQELESKSKAIAQLQAELQKKDVQIGELTESVNQLAGTVDELSQQTDQQAAQLAKQDKELNTGYYVFGTKSELKEEKIISGGGLFSSTKLMEGNFNKDYFTKVDIRKLKEVQLKAKKASMLSNMPEGSYQFTKDASGELTLVITDVNAFWSLTRYLVIQVDL